MTRSPEPRRAKDTNGAVGLVVVLVALGWLLYAVAWALFRQGENVQCACWADNDGAWQYLGQAVVAFVGSAALAAAVGMRRRRSGRVRYAAGVAVIAVGAWIVFLATST